MTFAWAIVVKGNEEIADLGNIQHMEISELCTWLNMNSEVNDDLRIIFQFWTRGLYREPKGISRFEEDRS